MSTMHFLITPGGNIEIAQRFQIEPGYQPPAQLFESIGGGRNFTQTDREPDTFTFYSESTADPSKVFKMTTEGTTLIEITVIEIVRRNFQTANNNLIKSTGIVRHEREMNLEEVEAVKAARDKRKKE